MIDVGRTPDGRRRQVSRSTGTSKKRAAERVLADVVTRLGQGTFVDSNVTTGQYLTSWLAGRVGLRPSTRRSYSQHVEGYLIPAIGRVRLSDLRATNINAMLTTIRERKVRPVGPTTEMRILATLRKSLNDAVRQRLIPYNPVVGVETRAPKPHPTVVWDPPTVGIFLNHIKENRLFALFRLVIVAGLRRGEVVGLKWEDVDLDAGQVSVRHNLVMVGKEVVEGQPKTRKSVRTVPIDADTIAALKQWKLTQDLEHLEWGSAWHDSGRCFTREDGRDLSPEWLTRTFPRLAREAGVPVIKFHALRHTSASLGLAAGVALKVVSERLGHSQLSITSDLYSHVYPAVAQDAADRIAAIIPLRASA